MDQSKSYNTTVMLKMEYEAFSTVGGELDADFGDLFAGNMIAGYTTDYVNLVVEKVSAGDPTGGLRGN